MDFSGIMKIKNAWSRFTKNHPKFPQFLNAVHRKRIKEGSIVEIKIADPDGTELCTNIRVTASDIELFDELRKMNM